VSIENNIMVNKFKYSDDNPRVLISTRKEFVTWLKGKYPKGTIHTKLSKLREDALEKTKTEVNANKKN